MAPGIRASEHPFMPLVCTQYVDKSLTVLTTTRVPQHKRVLLFDPHIDCLLSDVVFFTLHLGGLTL